ncbi:MAG: TrkA C-terminal domain-containing protein [Limisphaerales bacterium]
MRTRTGASIVAIERNGANIINPGPDDELQVNDQVLVLGSDAHLERACKLLLGENAVAENPVQLPR